MKAHRTDHRKSLRRSAAANQAQRAFLPEAGHQPGRGGMGLRAVTPAPDGRPSVRSRFVNGPAIDACGSLTCGHIRDERCHRHSLDTYSALRPPGRAAATRTQDRRIMSPPRCGFESPAYLRKRHCDYHSRCNMTTYSRRHAGGAADHPILRASTDGRRDSRCRA